MNFLFWFSLIIPFMALLSKVAKENFQKIYVQWAAGIFLAIVGLDCLFWFAGRASLTADYEYWTGYVKSTYYREDWIEIKIVTKTDANGKTYTETETIYHSPEWGLIDTNDIHVSLKEGEYVNIANRLGKPNPPTTNTNRMTGSKHTIEWDNNKNHAIPITTRHRFENRTLTNSSVFSFQDMTKKQASEHGLYDWPDMINHFYAPCVLGCNDPNVETIFQHINADLGKSKQIRITLLFFYDKSPEIASLQESYWKNGKKNELVICIGMSGDVFQWCKVFSWSESEDLKTEIANYLEPDKNIDWTKFSEFVKMSVVEKWNRKNFKDFNYLSIEMPMWIVIVNWFIAIGSSITFWACMGNRRKLK